MKTTIVSRTMRHHDKPVPVYRIHEHDDGTVSMYWYGENNTLIPADPQPTRDEVAVYIQRAKDAPDGQIATTRH